MTYTKIYPLGPRVGPGSFDGFFDLKYPTMEEAIAANDIVVADFVVDTDGIKHIECYHIRTPDVKVYHRINWQHFPFGLDGLDDHLAAELATTLFLK